MTKKLEERLPRHTRVVITSKPYDKGSTKYDVNIITNGHNLIQHYIYSNKYNIKFDEYGRPRVIET